MLPVAPGAAGGLGELSDPDTRQRIVPDGPSGVTLRSGD
jgi:hypothetical protein